MQPLSVWVLVNVTVPKSANLLVFCIWVDTDKCYCSFCGYILINVTVPAKSADLLVFHISMSLLATIVLMGSFLQDHSNCLIFNRNSKKE